VLHQVREQPLRPGPERVRSERAHNWEFGHEGMVPDIAVGGRLRVRSGGCGPAREGCGEESGIVLLLLPSLQSLP
jgi:hypothetical protein